MIVLPGIPDTVALWDVTPPGAVLVYSIPCVWSRDAVVCGRATCDDMPPCGWGSDDDGCSPPPDCYSKSKKS